MSKSSHTQTSRLSFGNISLPASGDEYADVNSLSFSLDPGELLAIMFDGPGQSIPLADLASGLLSPTSGEVLFKGKHWQSFTPFAQCRHRGTIRRNYSEEGWISNLTVYDNVLLASRHRNMSEKKLILQADALADKLGVSPVPRQLPALCSRHVLRHCDWVRLFVGHPEIMFLDRPLIDERRPAFAEAFIREVAAFLAQGGCCVWMDHQHLPEQLQAACRLWYSQGQFTSEKS